MNSQEYVIAERRPLCNRVTLLSYGGVEHEGCCRLEPNHPGNCKVYLENRTVAAMALRALEPFGIAPEKQTNVDSASLALYLHNLDALRPQ